MKALVFLLIFLLNLTAYSQNDHKNKTALVMDFLNYVKEPGWKLDTLVNRYLLFRNEESPRFSRDQRKMMISFAVAYLSTEIKSIDFNDLIIKPYKEIDSSMQTMFIKPERRENTYVVYTTNRQFKRYFLVESNKIVSFITMREGKAFLLLN